MQAEILRVTGDWLTVANLAQEALSLEPNYLQAHLLRAEGLAQMGQTISAAEELKEMITRHSLIDKETPLGETYGGYNFFILSSDYKRYEIVRAYLNTQINSHRTRKD